MTSARVLIVEDERIIAKGIDKQLRRLGYTVAGAAASGEEAVQKALELQPDLILMDISLGAGIDGVEAANRIHEQLDIPVAYLTANSDAATLQRAKLTGPHGYVLKPYDDKDLQTAIEIGLYRHEAERRLRESEQWLSATLGSIGDGVIATDGAGAMRFMNSRAEQLTGWAHTDVRGRDVREIFRMVTEKGRQPVTNPVAAALEKGETVAFGKDTLLVDKAGTERPIDGSAAVIRSLDEKMSGAVLVFRDVSLSRDLQRLREDWMAVVAHDLRQPIAVIAMATDDLAERLTTSLSADDAAAIRRLRTSAARLNRMVDDLLDVSQIEARCLKIVPEPVDLEALVGEIVDRAIPGLKGRPVRIQSHGGELRVRADPGRIEQVLVNLLVNAVKYGEAATEIRIELEGTPLEARVSVINRGKGMDPVTIEHVFDRFFRGQDAEQGGVKGLGLGLFIVKGIVEAHGGRIDVESVPGQETRFRFSIPRAPGATVPAGANQDGLRSTRVIDRLPGELLDGCPVRERLSRALQ